MKYIFAVLAILISFSSNGQQMSYKEWQEEAKTNIILLPEYGNVPKTIEQIKADDDFIKISLKTDTTPRKASEHLVRLGFDYLYRGDLKTAMSRFNLAWLLDHNNENAYWGFGVVYGSFNDYELAIAEYDKGLAINPFSAVIITDKATMNMNLFASTHNNDYFNKAITLFNQSFKIDPLNQTTLFKLSAAYYYNQDCTNAWKYYNECIKLGGKPITEEYTNALKKMCSR